ncbi:VOC family protein [Sinosporangium siamense]|uniref:Hydroxylase n=1 Tax=Sinosporangium siamense TaxID=1367973 RepID=A0A919VG11_9ACTN|nr:VOC family protein [Sinosporangium siamense]GII96634.1 hydroxylase [Sinosporangium siamense]
MSQRTAYQPGEHCWVDLSSTDVPLAASFYGELFGWEAEFDPRPETGGYGQFRLNGRRVAGIGPTFLEGMPSVWNSYVAVRDAASTAARVQAAGGLVTMEPMPVLQEGTMAAFQDPGGAYFMVWQPERHFGAEIVNEPNSFCWSELATRDPEGARRFYPQVFGWEAETRDSGPMPYTEWLLDGRAIAGMLPMGPQFPEEVPPHWLPYFAVADCDATLDRARALSATTFVEPTELPIGRFGVLADPTDAAFGVIALNEAD